MPEFATQAYWEHRFTKNGSPFDWLIPANSLCEITSDWIAKESLRKAEVLHIGCGTSVSSALLQLVPDPRQIHNVDYSQAAVDAAMEREREQIENDSQILVGTLGKGESVQQPEPSKAMRWSCFDLLDLDATLSLLDQQAEVGKLYDLVLDKSTSDSIACGSDVSLQLPYPLSINGWTRGILQSGLAQSANIHPLHVLAVHLAALTTPGTGRWLVISYSDDRFPFIPPLPQSASHGFLPDSVIRAGFPHPQQLWKLETKEKIDLDSGREETLTERKKRLASGNVRRPQVSHWLYIFVRTDVLVTD